MSSLQERKLYLQLWSFTTGPAIDVMKHYFEVKVLNTSSFESFLNDINNMHKLFHQCFPTTRCCYCVTASLAAPKKKGCLNLGQFDKLYDNSGSPQPSHEIMKGYKVDQICLCKYSAKSSVTVNDLDITLFNDIVQHCCSSKINFVWRKSIKDVRNFLAHAGTGYVNKQDFDDNWKTLTTATLGFAAEIGKVCEKMFQTEIVRIQNCSTDELKGMLENSTENQAKMLNLLNGFKPIVDECKKTAELVHMKQESHDKKFENVQSALGQSTREIGEIKHKMNKFDSFMKLMVEEKGKCTCDGSKRIKIETLVDNPCWNDENTTKRLCEMINADVDEKNADKEEFFIKNVENKCIQMELVAFPDVFKSPQSLRKAIKILINQLIDAGEVDTSNPGRMDIEFTIKTPLTKEEMAVAYSVFSGQDNLDDSTENGLDLKPNLQDHISVFTTITLDTKSSDNSDSEMNFKPTDERFVLVKPEATPARYEEFFITVENVRCLLKITGLPENAEVPDGIEHALDNKGNRKFYVELTLECPDNWNAQDVVSHMNTNLTKLHGYFHIDFLEQPLDRNITIQTTVEENVFLSETSLESAFQQLISSIRTVCNLQSTRYEELSVSATVLSVSDRRDEKKAVKEEIENVSITSEDNNIRCQFCTTVFECYKCADKIERIRILSRANRMKEQTISRLVEMSSSTEKEIKKDDESDYDSYYSAEKNTINEEPEEDTRKTTTAEIEMTGEPEQKKRKTAITSEIENSAITKDNQTEDASKSLNHLVVDMKQALQKLSEISLLDHYIGIYRKYIKDLRKKWRYGYKQINPKNEQAILTNLLKEKKKRTKLIVKLKDVIHNKDEFATTDEGYATDIRFLDVENPATKCNYCHTKDESQISCYCNDCKIFICDNCMIEHRMKNRNHSYYYLQKILREHKQSGVWKDDFQNITGIKFMAPEIVAILDVDILRTYNLSGRMINCIPIRRSEDLNRQIACLNDSTIAVTMPSDNLIEIVTVMAPSTKTDLVTPAGTIMTGGITCRMDILCVAFTDAIRLIDLSGQIQRVINIPSVKILHSVNNDKLLCVYSKCDSDKTMSCLDITNDSLHDFERFPFHPRDVTIDDVGNIIFTEDGVIWQSDSDGKNFKIIMTANYDHWYKHLTYNKRSKMLLTVNLMDDVEVYKKLE